MQHEVRNIDIEIEQAKKSIALRDALVRLEKNRDFRKVVTEGFLKEFALNTIAVRGRPEFRNSEALMESNTRKLDAMGELHEYFRNVKSNGLMMESALSEAQELRDEVAMEE
jgi:hypothetical protein